MSYKNCVYRFLNQSNEILYIGKASGLRNRLKLHDHLPQSCYNETDRIEFLSFKTKDDMELAEKYFIAKCQPRYNTREKATCYTLSIPVLDEAHWTHYIPDSKDKVLVSKVGTSSEDVIFQEPQPDWTMDMYENERIKIESKLDYLLEKLKLSVEAQEMALKGYHLIQVKGNPIEVYAKSVRYGYKVLRATSLDYSHYVQEKTKLLQEKERLLEKRDQYIKERLIHQGTVDQKTIKRFAALKATDANDFREKCIESIIQKFYQECVDHIKAYGYYDVNYLQVETFDELVGSDLCCTEWIFPGQKGPTEEMKKLSDDVALEIERRLDEAYGPFEEGFTLEWREETYRSAKEFQFPVWIKKVASSN